MNELLDFLKEEGKHLILFGGKGGVGKTSIAAATAIKCSEMGLKTLITSSDPAHSLSDVFEQKSIIGGQIVEVWSNKNLFALETDPKKVLDEYNHYLEEFPELKILLGEEFEEFPGANEGFGLLNIIRRFNNDDWDVIIVDTAPTGHTLKLLSFPDFLSKTAIKLIRIRDVLGSFVDKITNFMKKMLLMRLLHLGKNFGCRILEDSLILLIRRETRGSTDSTTHLFIRCFGML